MSSRRRRLREVIAELSSFAAYAEAAEAVYKVFE